MKKQCPECGIIFETNFNKKFCCLTHQQNFNTRKKAKRDAIENPPEYACPECGEKVKLDFSPRKENEKWLTFISNFKCKKCQ